MTTSFVTVEQLDKIHEEMKSGESLLICAKSFAPQGKERHGNITIKKIPHFQLENAEFEGPKIYPFSRIEPHNLFKYTADSIQHFTETINSTHAIPLGIIFKMKVNGGCISLFLTPQSRQI
ncbi:MAG: hypothetical protein HY920_01625 [Elusimicrobia bacterium]|nr:hypothetical protein [Elusimicrobiota bacterium]